MAQAPTASPTHIVIRPNRSLSFRGMVWLLSAYLGLMAVIGPWFWGAGAWMVLPFAGVEAVLIFLIFYFVVYRHTERPRTGHNRGRQIKCYQPPGKLAVAS
ncbi:MAG: DUF2244 domain-containing protein [Gammaproteobacteria bacterium]|nr:DUF2244 domain-containing protein [Gammaproteobacteria bacterium]